MPKYLELLGQFGMSRRLLLDGNELLLEEAAERVLILLVVLEFLGLVLVGVKLVEEGTEERLAVVHASRHDRAWRQWEPGHRPGLWSVRRSPAGVLELPLQGCD